MNGRGCWVQGVLSYLVDLPAEIGTFGSRISLTLGRAPGLCQPKPKALRISTWAGLDLKSGPFNIWASLGFSDRKPEAWPGSTNTIKNKKIKKKRKNVLILID